MSARAESIPAPADPASPADASRPLLETPGLVAPFVVAAVALALGAYPLGGTALLAAFVGAVLVLLAAIDLERGFLLIFPVAICTASAVRVPTRAAPRAKEIGAGTVRRRTERHAQPCGVANEFRRRPSAHKVA